MIHDLLIFNDLETVIVYEGGPQVDKDVSKIEDPRNGIDHIIGFAPELGVDADPNRNDKNRVQGDKDDEDIPHLSPEPVLDGRDFPAIVGALIDLHSLLTLHLDVGQLCR